MNTNTTIAHTNRHTEPQNQISDVRRNVSQRTYDKLRSVPKRKALASSSIPRQGNYTYAVVKATGGRNAPGTTQPVSTERQVQPKRHSRPDFFGQNRVICIFIATFGIVIVVIEVLFRTARLNSGLSSGSPAIRYVWGYGTTALFTAIAALWSRVEYSAQVAAPWIKSNPITASSDALLTDYIGAWKIFVPFRALRHGDLRVAGSTLVSLLLNATIILSTGLILLETLVVDNLTEAITLETRFVDDPSRLGLVTALPQYTIAALAGQAPAIFFPGVNLDYPIGLSNQAVYQSFRPNLSGLQNLQATVEGIYFGLNCSKATFNGLNSTQMIVRTVEIHNQTQAGVGFEFPEALIEYNGCQHSIPINFTQDGWDILLQPNPRQPEVYAVTLQTKSGFNEGDCQSDDLDSRRLVFLYLAVLYNQVGMSPSNDFPTPDPTNGLSNATDILFNVTDYRSEALVCAPTYELTSVDLVFNATSVVSVLRHPGAPSRPLPNTHPWHILSACLSSMDQPHFAAGSWEQSLSHVEGNSYANNVLSYANMYPDATFGLNATTLQHILDSYFEQLAVIVLRHTITEGQTSPATAASRRIVDRLTIQPIVSQAMVLLLALCIMIAGSLLFLPLDERSASIQPGSILATAVLAGSTQSLQFPRNLGMADDQALKRAAEHSFDVHCENARTRNRISSAPEALSPENPSHSNESMAETYAALKPYRPFVLRFPSKIALCISLLGVMITLETTFQKSTQDEGLGDVQDPTYLHYTWTILPTATMALLATWVSSVDFQVRLLAPYLSLWSSQTEISTLGQDFLRPILPMVLYQEYQAREFGALSLTTCALISSFFTAASGPLFRVSIFPVQDTLQLRMDSAFIPVIKYTTEDVYPITSLILESNLSYSKLVYENLVLPSFSLEGLIQNTSQQFNITSSSINATVPALRPGLICEWFDQANITIATSLNATIDNISHWNVNVTVGFGPCGVMDGTNLIPTGNTLVDFYFGLTSAEGSNTLYTSSMHPSLPGCHDIYYAWGRHSPSNDSSSTNIWALGCNSTLETLDTKISFIGQDLTPSPDGFVTPLESTARIISRTPPMASTPTTISASYGTYVSSDPDLFTLYSDGSIAQSSLASLPVENNTLMDPFFEQLITSRYAIPLEAVGNHSQTELVKDAIEFQHSLLAAQHISANYRRVLNFTGVSNFTDISTFYSIIDDPGVFDKYTNVIFPTLSTASSGGDPRVYPATVTNPIGRKRVVQDSTATRVLESFLLATLVLSILGHLLGRWKPMLPCSPTNVISVLALLAGGDVLQYLYRHGMGDCLTLQEAKERLKGATQLRLRWGPVEARDSRQQLRYGIWISKKLEE